MIFLKEKKKNTSRYTRLYRNKLTYTSHFILQISQNKRQNWQISINK